MLIRAAAALTLFAATVSGRTYPLDGIVVSVDSAARTLTLAHRPVPGFMPAMVMPFRLAKDEPMPAKLQAGQRVACELVVAKSSHSIRRIRPFDTSGDPLPAPPQRSAIGQPFPDFTLTTQNGDPLSLSSLRGSAVAVNFLYTRCPLPDVCPRLAAQFAALARRHQDRRDAAFLSITIDPRHDTPAVLSDYAKQYRSGDRWMLLTGEPEAVAAVAASFGLVYWPEEGSIGHNSVTAIIGRDGRLRAFVEGSSHRLDQLAALFERYLNEKPASHKE